MPQQREKGPVKTTQISLDMIEVVKTLENARLTEIADSMGLAKSTAHKHLTTLERNGFLRKVGNSYRIGLRFLHHGEHVRLGWPGFKYISEGVTELTERTGEEIDFVVEDRGRIMTIEESYHPWVKYDDSSRSKSKAYRARIGDYYRMHATAAGLAILAEYPPDRVRKIIDQWGLPARTDRTITSRATLFKTLKRIRKRGYAINDQGYTEGLRSLGKTVIALDGSVIGAFSVSGPSYRIDGAVIEEELPTALQEVVESVETELAADWTE